MYYRYPIPAGYKPLGEGIHEQAILVESIVNRISYEQYFGRTDHIGAQLMDQRKTWNLGAFSDERATNAILNQWRRVNNMLPKPPLYESM